MMTKGWIRLHRSLLNWEWYDDVNTRAVFIHLLLTASLQTVKWHGILIPRGGRFMTRELLAKEVNLSVQNVRTALLHLQKSGEVTITSQSKKTVIVVNNFDRYQTDHHESTENQPEINRNSTASPPQYKNNKKEKIKNEKERETRARIPSMEEVRAFCLDRQSKVNPEKFYSFYEANGWMRGKDPIVDWKALVRVWEVREDEFAKARKAPEPEDEMTQEEIDTMNDYLSLVNRFAH